MKKITLLILILLNLGVWAQDYKVLYKSLNPSVVTLNTREVIVSGTSISAQEGLGTGVLIDSLGHIITASHVVHKADEIMVSFPDGQQIPAEVVSSIPAADIAMVKLKSRPKNPTVAKLGNSDNIDIGEEIFVIGAPFGLEHTLSIGHISGKMQREMVLGGFMVDFLQTDAAINQGNSGGPIFNLDGEVVGIVSFILSQSGGFDGLGFAVSINSVKRILFESGTFWTGFEGLFLSNEMAKIFNVPQNSGVLVQRVTSNSMADKIGLKPGFIKANLLGQEIWIGGDIILSIQGISCNNPHSLVDIRAQLESLRHGEAFTMTVLRGGEILKLEGLMN